MIRSDWPEANKQIRARWLDARERHTDHQVPIDIFLSICFWVSAKQQSSIFSIHEWPVLLPTTFHHHHHPYQIIQSKDIVLKSFAHACPPFHFQQFSSASQKFNLFVLFLNGGRRGKRGVYFKSLSICPSMLRTCSFGLFSFLLTLLHPVITHLES